MVAKEAVDALGALAQDHRLSVFRLLVQAGSDGLAAGVIAEALGCVDTYRNHRTMAARVTTAR